MAGQNKSYSGEGKEAWSNILSYQQVFDQGRRIGLLSTNRFFKDGGHGQLFGINGLIGLSKTIDLNFEYNFSTLEEPISSWIDSSAIEGGKTVTLDGETKNGSGLSVILTRNTNNWTSNLSYDYLTPNYEAPLGFITQNDLQTLNFNQRYTYFPKDKSSLIQNLNANANGSLDYTIDGLPRFAGLFFDSRIVWRKNFRTGTEFITP